MLGVSESGFEFVEVGWGGALAGVSRRQHLRTMSKSHTLTEKR